METIKRIDSIEGKGSCRRCEYCGDVKIWDYPNLRKCPSGKRHKWRHKNVEDLNFKEKDSIQKQIESNKKDLFKTKLKEVRNSSHA